MDKSKWITNQHGEKKPEGCIHPEDHRCKGCELSFNPELSDGGCKLLDQVFDEVNDDFMNSPEEELDDTEEFDEFDEDTEDESIRTTDERENVIEWYTGRGTVTVDLTQRKMINKVLKLKERFPDEIEILRNNADGLCAHIPLRYLSIRRPREVSEEQRERMKEVAAKNIAEGKLKPRRKSSEDTV